jgi:nitroreductase
MRAMLAPSTHNTQPWRFVAGPSFLDLFADPTRGLSVIDPDSRQLIISCGAALFGARLSLAADGVPATVDLLPDASDPTHLARVHVTPGSAEPDPAAVELDRVADERHTNRRPFTPEPVPAELVSRLQEAAETEGAFLRPVTSATDRALLSALTAEAESSLFSAPAYRTELREWAGYGGSRHDGIPPEALPRAGSAADPLPTRGFDQVGTGRLPAAVGAEPAGCLLLLGTDTDDPSAWLHAGQALGRVLAEITRAGLVAGLYTQLTEIHRIREQVRSVLHLPGYPHVLLRVGHAEKTPATPRRPVPEVLTMTSDPA